MFAIVDIRTINTIFVRWHSSVSFVELRSEFTFCPCTFYSFAHTHVVSSNSDVVQVPNTVSFVELRISSNSDVVQYFISFQNHGMPSPFRTSPMPLRMKRERLLSAHRSPSLICTTVTGMWSENPAATETTIMFSRTRLDSFVSYPFIGFGSSRWKVSEPTRCRCQSRLKFLRLSSN